jgi:hypothetical protein
VPLVHDRHSHVEQGVPGSLLRQQQQDPLQAQRPAGGRHVRPAELIDQVVIPPAASQ